MYRLRFFLGNLRPPISTLFPYTTLFRSLVSLTVATVTGQVRRAGAQVGLPTAAQTQNAAQTGTAAKAGPAPLSDRKSTRLNSSHGSISYAVFCLKKKRELTSPIIRLYDH